MMNNFLNKTKYLRKLCFVVSVLLSSIINNVTGQGITELFITDQNGIGIPITPYFTTGQLTGYTATAETTTTSLTITATFGSGSATAKTNSGNAVSLTTGVVAGDEYVTEVTSTYQADKSLTKDECKVYGESINKWGGELDALRVETEFAPPLSCYFGGDGNVYFLKSSSARQIYACSTAFPCVQKIFSTNLEIVVGLNTLTVFSSTDGYYEITIIRATTLGQRITSTAISKPPGFHDIQPPKLMLSRSDGRPALYIETLSNPLPADGVPTTNNSPVLNVLVSVQTVTMHLWISDDFSGCKTVEIMTSGRDGSDTTSIMRQSAPRQAEHGYTSTRLNGRWELQKAIPSLSANGTWAISFIRLTDLQGNVYTYFEPELIALGVPTKYQVISALCMTSPWLCPEYRQIQDLVNKDDERNNRQAWIYYYYRQVWYDPQEPVCGLSGSMCQKPGTFIDFDKAIEVESAIQKNRPTGCNPITHLCGEDANEVYELNAEIFLNMTGLINNVEASIWDKNSYIAQTEDRVRTYCKNSRKNWLDKFNTMSDAEKEDAAVNYFEFCFGMSNNTEIDYTQLESASSGASSGASAGANNDESGSNY